MQVPAAPCPSAFEIDFDMIIYDCNPDHRRLRVTLHTSDASALGRRCYYFSPASSVAAAGADSSATVSLAASAPSASVATAASAASVAASAAAVAAAAAASSAAAGVSA